MLGQQPRQHVLEDVSGEFGGLRVGCKLGGALGLAAFDDVIDGRELGIRKFDQG
ncbi:hypothetical protein D3C86_2134380 [compost metagenome]